MVECPGCQHAIPRRPSSAGSAGRDFSRSVPPARPPTRRPTSSAASAASGCAEAAPSPAPVAAEPVPAAPPDPLRRPRSPTPRSTSPRRSSPPRAPSRASARLVTVMFSDVSGFTAMSEKLDPEDVHAHHGPRLRGDPERGAPLRGHDQPVPRRRRDGPLRGADRARGPRPSRAERRARDPGRASATRRRRASGRTGVEFRMRMGINTGLVVVGAIGRDLRMDYTAVGDTTNLAARLLGHRQAGPDRREPAHPAPAGGVLRLRGSGRFPGQGKDRAGPRLCRRAARFSGRTRLEVSKERGLTPLVGRDRELRASRRYPPPRGRRAGRHRAARGRTGGRQVPPALRVPAAASRRTDVLELETTCVSYGRSMAYRPIVDLLRRYLGLTEGVAGDEIRSRVAEQLQFLGLEGEEPVILLAHFLGVSAPPEFLNRLSGPQLKERTLGAAARRVPPRERGGAARPHRREHALDRCGLGGVPRVSGARACPAIASCWC